MKEYSNVIADTIKRFCRDFGRNYSFDDEGGIFLFTEAIGDSNELNIYIDVEENRYCVLCPFPSTINSEDKILMILMSEFVNRVNYENMLDGLLIFNVEDGEIGYFIKVDCSDIIPSNTMIKNSLDSVVKVYNKYYFGISCLKTAYCDSEVAIEVCGLFDEQ